MKLSHFSCSQNILRNVYGWMWNPISWTVIKLFNNYLYLLTSWRVLHYACAVSALMPSRRLQSSWHCTLWYEKMIAQGFLNTLWSDCFYEIKHEVLCLYVDWLALASSCLHILPKYCFITRNNVHFLKSQFVLVLLQQTFRKSTLEDCAMFSDCSITMLLINFFDHFYDATLSVIDWL